MTTEDKDLELRIAELERRDERREAEMVELRRRVDRDDEDRRDLMTGTAGLFPALLSQQEKWQHAVMGIVDSVRQSPEIGNARADALLGHFNKLLLWKQEFENQFHEMRALVVTMYDMVRSGDEPKGD